MQEKKLKILIIEDERTLADVLEAKLKKENYETDVAYDGEEGFEAIKIFKPDIVLLDIIMPKMDGYEVLEKMKTEAIKIPVIIISNSGQPVEIEKAKMLGAVDFLIKAEFDPSEVLMKISNYLHGKNMTNANDVEIKPVAGTKDVPLLNIKVLLVEDESFLREICSKKLANEGYTVYVAADGEQAIDMLDKVKPNIALLDIILPAIDGFEILTKIRAHSDPNIKAMPVIMLSNLGQEDDIKKAMELGANNYLIKAHFSTDEISTKVMESFTKKGEEK